MKYHTKETAMNMIEFLIWYINHHHDEKDLIKAELEIKYWQYFLKGFDK